VRIYREEVYRAIRKENEEAVLRQAGSIDMATQHGRASATSTDRHDPLHSERFGDFEVPRIASSIPGGADRLPGGAALRAARADAPGSPFRCLVSLDVVELSFVVCDPIALWPGYAADLRHRPTARWGTSPRSRSSPYRRTPTT